MNFADARSALSDEDRETLRVAEALVLSKLASEDGYLTIMGARRFHIGMEDDIRDAYNRDKHAPEPDTVYYARPQGIS